MRDEGCRRRDDRGCAQDAPVADLRYRLKRRTLPRLGERHAFGERHFQVFGIVDDQRPVPESGL